MLQVGPHSLPLGEKYALKRGRVRFGFMGDKNPLLPLFVQLMLG
ncbi:hypothetical protein POREN0001_0889 [Porphyromonas endodontalis ATCC 35406]|uniref:Uncharacterized protein n=1 Tax=Porphyromonas endodontalis (strain ATCC 35406 / DSM 24491 / JCM 8526 / CCUG 16442 / BCRC 14492 / NCTC 13058 / HG 370) TaxID=553175 RepID=C3J9W7_POREA|nr:hypothetical protein POREN0001_0889 [Porphyromonas endodontalis ATCC 35406]